MIVSLYRKRWCWKYGNQPMGNFDAYLHPKNQFHLQFLSEDIVKALQTWYFGNFGNTWPSPSKIIVSICRTLSCFYACNKSASSVNFFLRYCKEIANLLFWVIWAHLTTPKRIVSIEEIFDVYLQAKNQLPFFPFSLRYCNDIPNLLFWVLCAILLTHN